VLTALRRSFITALDSGDIINRSDEQDQGYCEPMSSPKKTASTMRVQYAALPYRQKGKSSMDVLLVTSRRSGRWIIPKGWPLRGMAPHKAVAREALEEAGVIGKINRRAIGSYSYQKRLKSGRVLVCVKVFGLQVKRQEESWPEKDERKVKWLSRTKAAKIVRDRGLGAIIRALPKRHKSSFCREIGGL
jgi:8-oxo-dGTP pyrophosphatase MutT (NUDIX family)